VLDNSGLTHFQLSAGDKLGRMALAYLQTQVATVAVAGMTIAMNLVKSVS
jgi:hypothetical protein